MIDPICLERTWAYVVWRMDGGWMEAVVNEAVIQSFAFQPHGSKRQRLPSFLLIVRFLFPCLEGPYDLMECELAYDIAG
jgi:hypothetical protein